MAKEYTGPIEIDPATGVRKRPGETVIRGDQVNDLGAETVARQIALCEGKDPNDTKVIGEIITRLKKPVVRRIR